MYPEEAVRELVANALIHQDLFVSGAGPMVEIFADRMEIKNPGKPLVSADRFVDTPPKSRNETLASLMRRMGICEERGSGIDKVVFQTESFQLPAPLFEVPDDSTRVVLFGHRPLTRWTGATASVRATYTPA
jgi:predicted HTH transcriptional regulator